MPVLELTKPTRSGRPKVRTGCVTCKLRRVKCDEIKPVCHRCEKAGLKCAGYPPIPHRRNAAGTKPPVVVDRFARGVVRPLLPQHQQQSKLVRQYPSFFNLDPVASSYFDLFLQKVSHELSGSLYAGFWTRDVLRAAARDDYARQEIVAIGALSKALMLAPPAKTFAEEENRPMAPPHPDTKTILNQHHLAALGYHSSSISLFRKQIQNRNATDWARSVMTMTLLFLSFEFMQGNVIAANGIMSHGMKLLSNSFKILQDPTSLEDTQEAPQGKSHGLEEVDHLLPCISIMSGYIYLCKSQHELFVNIRCAAAIDVCDMKPLNMADLATQWGNFYLRCMLFVTHVMIHGLYERSNDKTALEVYQRRLIRDLRDWVPPLRKGKLTFGDSEQHKLSHLLFSIQRNVCMVLVSCCADETEMLYDSFNREFQKITDLCAEFIAARSSSNFHFMFNEGIVSSALSLVTSKCRNSIIRIGAVRLFKKMTWREGPWDGLAIASNLGQVALEEHERDSKGHIKSRSRWIWTDSIWDDEKGMYVAEYTRAADQKAPVNSRRKSYLPL